jgi:hypothetical protein
VGHLTCKISVRCLRWYAGVGTTCAQRKSLRFRRMICLASSGRAALWIWVDRLEDEAAFDAFVGLTIIVALVKVVRLAGRLPFNERNRGVAQGGVLMRTFLASMT